MNTKLGHIVCFVEMLRENLHSYMVLMSKKYALHLHKYFLAYFCGVSSLYFGLVKRSKIWPSFRIISNQNRPYQCISDESCNSLPVASRILN